MCSLWSFVCRDAGGEVLTPSSLPTTITMMMVVEGARVSYEMSSSSTDPVADTLWMTLSNGIMVASIVTFLTLRYIIKAPMGKYAPSTSSSSSASSGTSRPWYFGPSFPLSVSFFLFELPNLYWSWVCYEGRDREIFRTGNAVLLGMFTLHYVNRALIYPLRLKKSHKTPLIVSLSAFLFTSING